MSEQAATYETQQAIQPDPAMGEFIGIKLVRAKPMTRKEYNDFRGWQVPADENPDDEGMLVEYLDGGKANTTQYEGYVSWSPLGVFLKAYGPTESMTFGLALEAARRGARITRTGWNGAGLWVAFIPAGNKKLGDSNGALYPFRDYLAMKTVDDQIVPWVASQTDLLALDWETVK